MNVDIRQVLRVQKFLEDYHTCSNAGIGITYTLMFWALHEEFNWQKLRIEHLKDQADELTLQVKNLSAELKDKKYWDYHDELIKRGMDVRMFEDFIRLAPNVAGAHGNYEGEKVKEAARLTYIYLMASIRTRWKMSGPKMRQIQKRMKSDAWEIKKGNVRLVEFMKIVSVELGEYYSGLERYEKMFGNIEVE